MHYLNEISVLSVTVHVWSERWDRQSVHKHIHITVWVYCSAWLGCLSCQNVLVELAGDWQRCFLPVITWKLSIPPVEITHTLKFVTMSCPAWGHNRKLSTLVHLPVSCQQTRLVVTGGGGIRKCGRLSKASPAGF